ncbi:uncharacterized protein CIMG_12729 [Coccidioides immitis RS]|uniref:Uncharacterized protein n=1 Tax=Coccidioides immitis (strain RS) TaxID=246410 RepID=A0A0D8JUW9_COCIM|nr:uncharacterized protein CIMG_12729 [Coccidioides immitis RS]KJF60083.1 hypothetical protein CIMG_12729 [Coccidioides immitis RS]
MSEPPLAPTFLPAEPVMPNITISYEALNHREESVSENATRSIFGWLRVEGYPPGEMKIHEWMLAASFNPGKQLENSVPAMQDKRWGKRRPFCLWSLVLGPGISTRAFVIRGLPWIGGSSGGEEGVLAGSVTKGTGKDSGLVFGAVAALAVVFAGVLAAQELCLLNSPASHSQIDTYYTILPFGEPHTAMVTAWLLVIHSLVVKLIECAAF